jgi:hypothetical protein
MGIGLERDQYSHAIYNRQPSRAQPVPVERLQLGLLAELLLELVDGRTLGQATCLEQLDETIEHVSRCGPRCRTFAIVNLRRFS